MNHQEVVEEDKRNKLPSNWEARKRQAEWVLDDESKRKKAEEEVTKLKTTCLSIVWLSDLSFEYKH